MKQADASLLDDFICTMPDDFLMRSDSWLVERIHGENPPVILDVRDRVSFEKAHVAGSINIPLRELPGRHGELEKGGERKIICYCNGSVMSAYALIFLASQGFQGLYNLSGGFSRWQREERDVEGSEA